MRVYAYVCVCVCVCVVTKCVCVCVCVCVHVSQPMHRKAFGHPSRRAQGKQAADGRQQSADSRGQTAAQEVGWDAPWPPLYRVN